MGKEGIWRMTRVIKTVTIRKDQEDWIKKYKINLSWHVQAMIDELMITYNKKKGGNKNDKKQDIGI